MPTGHYERASLQSRFEAKYTPEPNTGCWLWIGAFAGDYGVIRSDGQTKYAHRVSYEMFVGQIPSGLDLDHLCRVRCCVNPQHLEPVSRQTNLLRGDTVTARNAAATSCRHGHPLSGDNLYIDKKTSRRSCRLCRKAADQRKTLRRQQCH